MSLKYLPVWVLALLDNILKKTYVNPYVSYVPPPAAGRYCGSKSFSLYKF
jgi:hypothetical protein